MGEVLTMTDIEARYDGEWVLLLDPELDQQGRIVRAVVGYHSPDRDDVYRADIRIGPAHAAYHFAGSTPTDAAIVL